VLNQNQIEISKILLETALENNGHIRSCPIEYLQNSGKWIFWNESWSLCSKHYDSFDEVLIAFDSYCKEYLDQEMKKRSGETYESVPSTY